LGTSTIKEPKKLFILVAAIIILGLYPTIVFNLIEPAIKQIQFIP
jgi:NADH:ubiquinone oxidoreductase subunit 4 (subunit M)